MKQEDKLQKISRILSFVSILIAFAAIIITFTAGVYWAPIVAFAFFYVSEIFNLFRKARAIRAEDDKASLSAVYLQGCTTTIIFAFLMYALLSFMQRAAG